MGGPERKKNVFIKSFKPTMLKIMDGAKKGTPSAKKKISAGDLSANIEPKSDKDVISAALKTTVESLRELIIDDGGRVLQIRVMTFCF